jgi:hypothetical protein
MKVNGTELMPVADHRVDSGPMRFGSDWTGVFMRGDHALGVAGHLRAIKDGRLRGSTRNIVLDDLIAELEACRVAA